MSNTYNNIAITEAGKENAFTYATYTIIYINDCAANAALDVCRALDKANYNGNGAKKICRGLKNRATEYFDLFNKIFEPTLDTIAEFSCVYDDFCDQPINRFRRLIKESLDEQNVNNAEFISYVETCRAVCEMACAMNDNMVKKMLPIDKAALSLKNWRLTKLSSVANDLAEFAYETSNAQGIDLNKNKPLLAEFDKWLENIFLYDNFKAAYKAASENINSKINNNN